MNCLHVVVLRTHNKPSYLNMQNEKNSVYLHVVKYCITNYYKANVTLT